MVSERSRFRRVSASTFATLNPKLAGAAVMTAGNVGSSSALQGKVTKLGLHL